MTRFQPLAGQTVAISISEAPDMGVIGMGREHLDDAMTETARHMLALGARLAYGGDLRKDGFSRLLFELVSRHRRDAKKMDRDVGVINYLAWPVHSSMSWEAISELSDTLKGTAELACLQLDGSVMSLVERRDLIPPVVTHEDWFSGLTSMRRQMVASSTARIVLGGRTEAYKGRYPGIAEEALCSLEAKQPLFILGGFGGCARDITIALGSKRPVTTAGWEGLDLFLRYGNDDLRNGLSDAENRELYVTPYIDQAITLVIRGMLRLWDPEG